MTEKIKSGDHFEADMGGYGDPRWPDKITMRLFRYDEIGQRLLVEEQEYRRASPREMHAVEEKT